jgi:hypothetical protein
VAEDLIPVGRTFALDAPNDRTFPADEAVYIAVVVYVVYRKKLVAAFLTTSTLAPIELNYRKPATAVRSFDPFSLAHATL